MGDLYNAMMEVSKLKSELADIRRTVAATIADLDEDRVAGHLTHEKRKLAFEKLAVQMQRMAEIVGT